MRLRTAVIARLAAMTAVALATTTVTAVSSSACPSPDQVFGQPDGLGFVVTDPAPVREQLRDAVGLDLQPPKTVSVSVRLTDGITRTVRLSASTTRADQPSTEIVQAQPSIGPWTTAPDHATPFLSYSVSDMARAGMLLRRAGFNRIAESAQFVFWQGLGASSSDWWMKGRPRDRPTTMRHVLRR